MEDVVRSFSLCVSFDVDFPQMLVQLCQRHLDGSLRRVDIDRREKDAGELARGAELVGEHELHQLGQNAVLGAENILEAAVGDACLVDDLRNCGFFIALLEKKLDADGQDPLFCGQTGTCERDRKHILSVFWLQEKLPVQRLAQRLADGDDDQHAADDDARDQRIERPEERLVDLEREIEQKLNEHGQRTA